MSAYRDQTSCSECAAHDAYSSRVLEANVAQDELIKELRADRDRLRRLADVRLALIVIAILVPIAVWSLMAALGRVH